MQKQKTAIQEMQDLLPKAKELLSMSLEGKPINKDRLQSAMFAIDKLQKFQQVENGRQTQERENKRFNEHLFNQYGSKDQKEELKKVFSKSLPKLNYIEK